MNRKSIPSVVDAMYRAISFSRGGLPDWETEELVFDPAVRLVRNSDTGREAFDLRSYRQNIESMIADGRLPSFHESEVAARIDEFGDIGHCFSTYEARSEPGGPVLFRGVNSIQLMRTGGEWGIVSMVWYRESESTPLPRKYLSG